MHEQPAHDAYFIPDIYADNRYMICSQVTGMRTPTASGDVDLRLGDKITIDERPYKIWTFLGEASDADENRIVMPLIVALRHLTSGAVHRYALEELIESCIFRT